MPPSDVLAKQMKLHGDQYRARFCPRVSWSQPDPVVDGSTASQKNATAHLAELLLAPSIQLLSSLATEDQSKHRLRHDDDSVRLVVVQPSSPDLGRAYRQLVARIAANVSVAIDAQMRAGAAAEAHANEGSEQIIPLTSSVESKALLARGRRGLRTHHADLATLLQRHIEPYLAQHVFAGRDPPKLQKFRISRNMLIPGETLRLRANTWHWDTGPVQPDRWLKVLLYLTDADTQSGCMMALRHGATKAPLKMDGTKIWGPLATPASVPREWLRAMFDDGYRPECLHGEAGSLVIFDTNIVHRGTRPAAGRHRDAINFEFEFRARRRAHKPAVQSTPIALTSARGLSSTPLSVETLVQPAAPTHKPLPAVGFGTANRKSAKGDPLIRSLVDFFSLGGRHVDSAYMYHNNAEVREAVARSKVPRGELWITSKLNTIRHLARLGGFVSSSDGVAGALATITSELGTFVDLLLIHDPKELTPEERVDVWRGMIAARTSPQGQVRQIGVSNFGVAQLQELEKATGQLPLVNEIEFHPWVSAATFATVRWCIDRGIAVVAYNSLGGKKNNAKGRVVAQLAQRHRVTNAQVLLRWALQHKVRVIPGATSRAHIQQNLNLSCFALSADEMALLQGSAKPRTFAKYR